MPVCPTGILGQCEVAVSGYFDIDPSVAIIDVSLTQAAGHQKKIRAFCLPPASMPERLGHWKMIASVLILSPPKCYFLSPSCYGLSSDVLIGMWVILMWWKSLGDETSVTSKNIPKIWYSVSSWQHFISCGGRNVRKAAGDNSYNNNNSTCWIVVGFRIQTLLLLSQLWTEKHLGCSEVVVYSLECHGR